VYEGQT